MLLRQVETVLLLVVAVLALSTIARRLLLPYPILLVIGGLVLAFTPMRSGVRLAPDLVFLVFLPPVLWAAAYFGSLREFRAHWGWILGLAVGLVLATTAAVAGVAHAVIPGLAWAPALLLGAIVSPPDAVAATAIARDIPIPRRVVTVLDGESLFNDATALVIYRAALDATATGTFSLDNAALLFVRTAVLGVAAGLAVAALARVALRVTPDPLAAVGITLVAPYAAWIVAEQCTGSPVLACVAGGFYMREHLREVASAAARVYARPVWDLVVYFLNGAIFILIGLQLGALRDEIPAGRLAPLLVQAGLITATVIAVRLLWVPAAALVSRVLLPRRWRAPPWSDLALIAWVGMRGIVSLAAALALPRTTPAGEPFPFRTQIILITFGVILSTLVVQGLSLVPVVRKLRFGDQESASQELILAREAAATAALERLDALASQQAAPPELRQQVERLRAHYAARLERLAAERAAATGAGAEARQPTAARGVAAVDERAYRQLLAEALAAERSAVLQLAREGRLSDETALRLEHEIDMDAVRLGLGDWRYHRTAGPGSAPVPAAAQRAAGDGSEVTSSRPR